MRFRGKVAEHLERQKLPTSPPITTFSIFAHSLTWCNTIFQSAISPDHLLWFSPHLVLCSFLSVSLSSLPSFFEITFVSNLALSFSQCRPLIHAHKEIHWLFIYTITCTHKYKPILMWSLLRTHALTHANKYVHTDRCRYRYIHIDIYIHTIAHICIHTVCKCVCVCVCDKIKPETLYCQENLRSAYSERSLLRGGGHRGPRAFPPIERRAFQSFLDGSLAGDLLGPDVTSFTLGR